MKNNMSRRQFVKFTTAGAASAASLGIAGCGSSSSSSSNSTNETSSSSSGSVYYLNFKPEVDEQWQELAQKYTDETGVEVEVVTAASDTYEQKLQSEMAKSSAPTLFQVNGPVGLQNWKDYCYDLSGSAIEGELTSSDLELKDGDSVAGVAFVEETYGLIYNKTLLTKAGYSESDITSFDTLKKIADDIQSRKDELGIKGAFTSAGMDDSSNWRYTTHLANLPIYYEYKADDETDTDAIKGTYLSNYKDVFDMYITDATCEGSELASKTGDDASNEFLNGQAVFYQNGTWAYDDIGTMGDDTLGMIPIYFGVDDSDQGLCTGSENYWCVNKNASDDDIQATLDFMYWVVTSDEGTTALADDMGFVCPFKSAKEATNPFVTIANDYISNGKTPISWSFTTIPSEEWKSTLSSALTSYAAGGSWDGVKTAFVDNWATEKAASE